jgi:hypothetical protein
MTKRFKSFVLASILLQLLLISCEKQLFDSRNKYLGDWKFDVSNSHEVFNTTQGFHDTTILITYQGEIKYGSEDNRIIFQSTSYSIEFAIDKNGNIIPENDYGMDYDESGGFEGRDIFKYYYYHRWGGTLHKYIETNINGERN